MAPAAAYGVWIALAATVVATIAARRRAVSWWQPAVLAPVATASVVAFAVVSWGRATPLGDFNKAYYPAGMLLFADPSRLYSCETSNLCFVNIPIVAALFTPLSVIDRLPAQIIFSVVGAAATVVAAWYLTRELCAGAVAGYAIVALFALNGPLLYSARLGNLTHVMLPWLVAAFAALARGRDGRAGTMLGGLAIIKPPLLLFLPYLVYRRRWRAAATLTGTVAAVVVASVLWFGLALHRVWLTQLAGPFSSRPVAAYNVQSITGMLAHLQRPENLTNWMPLDVSPAFMLVSYGLVAFVVAAAAAAFLASGAPASTRAHWTELSIVLVLVLLVGPLTWTHYYAFCLIPLALYATRTVNAPNTAMGFTVAAAAALISAPVVLWLPRVPILGSLAARVLVSHYVAGALLLLGALCVSRVGQWESSSSRPSLIVVA